MNKKQIEKIKKLVQIGLTYDVDQTYILEDIEKLLNGQDINDKYITPNQYYN